MRVKVAAACVHDVKGDKERNFAAATWLARELASAGAQLIVLPEVCLQGYPAADESLDREQVRAMGEPLEGSYARRFRSSAKELQVYLVAGYDRAEGRDLFNTAELIGPEGKMIGVYDKTHVTVDKDAGLYAPGKALPVFETEFGKVGILICIDRVYPEAWRVLVLKGARIVLIPANGGYGDLNTHRLQVMAHDNCVCVVFAHPRRGFIINSSGEVVDRDEVGKPFAVGELDLSGIDEGQANLRARRRVDLYGFRCE